MSLVRFKLNLKKCIEGIDFLAQARPGLTQYFICKVFYFADKEHLLDWGRPISGDRYIAMEHGPVPSYIYDLLKDTGTEPDDVIDDMHARFTVTRDGNKLKVLSLGNKTEFPNLSASEKSCLQSALDKYASLTFSEVRRISHEDRAYFEAWEKPGNGNEMDLRLWFPEDTPETQRARRDIEEMAALSHSCAH